MKLNYIHTRPRNKPSTFMNSRTFVSLKFVHEPQFHSNVTPNCIHKYLWPNHIVSPFKISYCTHDLDCLVHISIYVSFQITVMNTEPCLAFSGPCAKKSLVVPDIGHVF